MRRHSSSMLMEVWRASMVVKQVMELSMEAWSMKCMVYCPLCSSCSKCTVALLSSLSTLMTFSDSLLTPSDRVDAHRCMVVLSELMTTLWQPLNSFIFSEHLMS